MNTQDVVFRIDRSGADKQVTALLPRLAANPGNVVCYAHVGQHGEASVAWVRNRTRLATPAQYAPLLAELRSIYERSLGGEPAVKLRVRDRLPAQPWIQSNRSATP